MRDPADLLQRMVTAGEIALTRPFATVTEETALDQLRAEIDHDLALPAPDGRLIFDEDALLAQVLCMQCRAQKANDARRAQALQQVIGVLLPLSRAHAAGAIMAKHGVAPTDPQFQQRAR